MDSEGMSMPPRCMRPGAWHSAPCDFPGPQGKFQGKFPLIRLYSRFYYYPQGRDLEPRESLRLHQELSRWQMHCHLTRAFSVLIESSNVERVLSVASALNRLQLREEMFFSRMFFR